MMTTTALLTDATATGPGTSNTLAGPATVQAVGLVSSATGQAVIDIEVSNNGVNWITHDTITLTLSTPEASAGIEIDAPWAFIRANVTSISGTGAEVSVFLGENNG